MKKLHHPGTPCNTLVKDVSFNPKNLRGKLEVVKSNEGWGVFGKDSLWSSDEGIKEILQRKGTRIFNAQTSQNFYGWSFYSPINLEIEVTRDCNQDCIHCWNESGRDISLDLGQLEELLSEFRENGGQKVKITGGEPLVYEELFPLLEFVKKIGIRKIEMTSNGSLIDIDKAKVLSEYLNRINISLHGGNKQIHNKIVKRNYFDDTLNAIRYFCEQEIPTIINYTVMKENIESLPEICGVAKNTGADKIRFNLLMKKGRGKSLQEISRQEVLDLRKQIKSLSKKKSVPLERSELYPEAYLEGIREAKFYGCSALRSSLYVNADGNFFPCNLVPSSLGNIKYNSIKDIWNGNAAKEFRSYFFCEKELCDLSCAGKCKARENK